MSRPDLYNILGVPSSAGQDEIKAAFRNLAKQYHPDRFPTLSQKAIAHRRMQEINSAYYVLRDPARRREYHQHLDWEAPRGASPYPASAPVTPFDVEWLIRFRGWTKIFGRLWWPAWILATVLTTVLRWTGSLALQIVLEILLQLFFGLAFLLTFLAVYLSW